MTLDAAAIAKEAEEGLGSVGLSATLTPPATWTGTGADAVKVAGTPQPCTLSFSHWAQSQVDGTAIRVGDKRALIGAASLLSAPVPGSTLSFGGLSYDVIPPMEAIAPNGEAILYTCNLRLSA